SMLTRKKSYICAKDQNNILFMYTGKTKFLMKDALFLENLAQQININNKYFFSMTSLCSKAKNHLEMKGFNIYVAL
ncbi:TPA: tram-like protein, partial [Campylobacter jejuni]